MITTNTAVNIVSYYYINKTHKNSYMFRHPGAIFR